MKNCDKYKDASYLKYWNLNNLYGWAMSKKKLSVDGFKWVEEKAPKFNKEFIKHYNGDGDKSYFLEADVQYPEELHAFHND